MAARRIGTITTAISARILAKLKLRMGNARTINCSCMSFKATDVMCGMEINVGALVIISEDLETLQP